jgi:titin
MMKKSIMSVLGAMIVVLFPVSLWAAIPNSPSGLTATPLSSTQIQFTWTDNSSDETYFYIERKTGATGTYSQIGSVGANVTTYTNTGLTQGTEYYYRVRAYNASGYSTYSNEASATTLTVSAPSDLAVAAVSYAQVTLTWTDNSGEEQGYRIERKTGAAGAYTQVGSVSANITTYTNTGLTQGTEYYYRVRAYTGSNNSEYSNEVNTTTLALNAPSGLTSTATGATKIQLTWTDNSNDETGFQIERKTGSGNYAYVASVGASVTTYSNTGLTQNTEYFYRVRAYNGSNYSPYSNEANATTQTLGAPTNLSVSAVSYTQVTLTWTDNSSDETYFYIERKIGSTGTYSQIGSVGANVTTYTNTGLTQGTEYYYRVRAASGTNYSEYSNEVNVTTLAVNAPSGLTSTATGATKIQLTWTDNSNDETGFQIERKIGAGGSYSQIASVGANVSTYTNTGLTQNTEYYYRVRAYNGSNYSPYSNEANATTQTLSAPSNLSVSEVSYTRIVLTWTDNSSDEAGFYIERKTGAAGTYAQIGSAGANTTTYTNSGLTQGTEYYYRVRAYSGSNYSSYSNEIGATTLTFNAPSALTADPLSSSQIKLTWTDNTTDETYFFIECKIGETGTYTYLTSVSADTTAYTHTNLAQETMYYYRVRAYGPTGYSSYSNEASATTLTLGAPSNLTAAPLSALF